MGKPVCCRCGGNAKVKRPKTGEAVCTECFFFLVEEEVHHTLTHGKMFKRGERIVIGVSGGKDSTVLAEMMTILNKRYDYGLHLLLLSIDEGIKGYRDGSLETVAINQKDYGLPLMVLSFQDIYGWSMDEIVSRVGMKNSCTYCGVFRRQALDRGAAILNANKVATGHNADDLAETVMMNLLRGDSARLQRCAALETASSLMPRVKPFKYTYQKEIVLYAHYKKLAYFSTECTYAPEAFRGTIRDLLKKLERHSSRAVLDIIHSGEEIALNSWSQPENITMGRCIKCGYVCSAKVCKACHLVDCLAKGDARAAVHAYPESWSKQALTAAAASGFKDLPDWWGVARTETRIAVLTPGSEEVDTRDLKVTTDTVPKVSGRKFS